MDSSGVWVDTFDIGSQGAASVTTLAASGAVTVGGTLAVTGVGTFTAKPVLNGGADINEEVDIDLDAADEEIDIKQAAVAGTADTPLISIDDDRTGATANTPGEATLKIDAEGTHAIGILDGILAVESSVDTYAAVTMKVGDDRAIKLELAEDLLE